MLKTGMLELCPQCAHSTRPDPAWGSRGQGAEPGPCWVEIEKKGAMGRFRSGSSNENLHMQMRGGLNEVSSGAMQGGV